MLQSYRTEDRVRDRHEELLEEIEEFTRETATARAAHESLKGDRRM